MIGAENRSGTRPRGVEKNVIDGHVQRCAHCAGVHEPQG